MRYRYSAILFVLLVVSSAGMARADDRHAGAEQMANQMLTVIGGRERWAKLRNTINGSQQNRVVEPTVVYAVITMDFEQPRFRIETTAEDLHLIRVIDGDNSWRLRGSGAIEDVPPALLNEELKWYASHLYRTIHRLAARDPVLSLKVNDKGRLEIHERGERLLWLELDAKGEPYRFGFHGDDTGSLSGPWDVVQDGIHHPRWISSADGTWRAAIRSLAINVPLSGNMFARPAGD